MKYIENPKTPVNADRLWEELRTAYPTLDGLRTGPWGVVVRAPDDFTQEIEVHALIEAHDPSVLSTQQAEEEERKLQFEWLKTQFRPGVIQNAIDTGDHEAALNMMLQAMRALGKVLRE